MKTRHFPTEAGLAKLQAGYLIIPRHGLGFQAGRSGGRPLPAHLPAVLAR